MRRGWIGLALGCLLALLGAETALAQTKVLIYSGTVGYRHANSGEAIQTGVVDVIQSKLQAAGITSDYRSCNGAGTGAGTLPGCQNATVGNPAIFTASRTSPSTTRSSSGRRRRATATTRPASACSPTLSRPRSSSSPAEAAASGRCTRP